MRCSVSMYCRRSMCVLSAGKKSLLVQEDCENTAAVPLAIQEYETPETFGSLLCYEGRRSLTAT